MTFDGVSVGDSFGQIETEKYTVKSNVPSQYTYNYEEWRLSVEDSTITAIMASFGQVSISINGNEDCSSVDNVINVLGDNFSSTWYDKEQGLMQLQYLDQENGIQCAFVYNKYSNDLVWGIVKIA